MAITNWRIGWVTATSGTLFIRSDDGASYTCGIGGAVGSVSTGGPDNTGLRTQVLTPNTEYTVTIDGVVQEGVVLKTPPDDQVTPIRIMTTNCNDKRQTFPFGKIVKDRAPHLFAWMSDNGYNGVSETRFGVPITTTISTGAGDVVPVSAFRSQMRGFEANPGVARVNRHAPNIWIPGNHEWGGDLDDHTPYSWDNAGNILQNEANQSYANYMQVLKEWRPEPPYETAHDGLDIPFQVDFTGVEGVDYNASDYQAIFYEGTFGMVDIFVLDCTGGKHPNDWFSEPVKDMFGDDQLAWAHSRINASTNIWRMVFMAYPLSSETNEGGRYPNSWANFPTARAAFLAGITDRTGIIFAGGDWHAPSIHIGDVTLGEYASTNMGAGSVRGHPAFPIYQVGKPAGGDAVYAGEPQLTPIQQDTIGQFDFTASKLTLTALNSQQQAMMVAEMSPDDQGFTVVSTIAHPVEYDEQVLTGSSGEGSDLVGFDAAKQPMDLHGWSVDGNGTRDIGLSFPIGIDQGTLLRSVELDINITGITAQGALRQLRIILEDTDLGNPIVPWQTDTHKPKDVNKSAHTQDVDMSLFDPGFEGCVRFDVTALLQQLVNKGNWTSSLFLNINISFKDGADDYQIENDFARLIIQTYD